MKFFFFRASKSKKFRSKYFLTLKLLILKFLQDLIGKIFNLQNFQYFKYEMLNIRFFAIFQLYNFCKNLNVSFF